MRLVVVVLGVVLALAILLSPGAAQAPDWRGHDGEPPIHQGPGGRVALDGAWRFARDPQDRGLRKGWHKGRFTGSIVRVPFVPDAEDITEEAGTENHQGSVGWYSTTLRVPTGGEHVLRFESANHRATVWLDGEQVGAHVGVYLPFEVRVPLKSDTTHRLVVRTDWRSPAAMKHDGWHRTWFNFGGLARGVTVRRVGPSELADPTLRTRLTRDGTAKVDVTVRVRNHRAGRELDVEGALERDGRSEELDFEPVRVDRDGSATAKASVEIEDPVLWAPRSGALWNLRLAVPGESSYRARVGLREIAVRRGRILVNKRPVTLRGASIHEDVPGRGDGLYPADHAGLVHELEQLGANATRAQHPLHPALLEQLDAAGILVWQGIGPVDAPGAWTSKGERRRRTATARVRTTVRQQQMHPSILTWNLANEVAGDGHPAGQASWIDETATKLGSLWDPSRPVALDVWGSHPPTERSRMYDHIDLLGWTNYLGWYEEPFATPERIRYLIRKQVGALHRIFPEKGIAVTEFGAEGNTENPPDYPGGLRFQERLLRLHVRTYEQLPYVSGYLVWNLRDFAVAPSFAGGSISRSVPDIKLVRGLNQKGLHTYEGRRKPAARAIARVFKAAGRSDG